MRALTICSVGSKREADEDEGKRRWERRRLENIHQQDRAVQCLPQEIHTVENKSHNQEEPTVLKALPTLVFVLVLCEVYQN